jgi:hypothetical protein
VHLAGASVIKTANLSAVSKVNAEYTNNGGDIIEEE